MVYPLQTIASLPSLRVRLNTALAEMAETQVNSMVQDTLGYLWFSTNKGLLRFDGEKAKWVKAWVGNKQVEVTQISRLLVKTSFNRLYSANRSVHVFDPVTLKVVEQVSIDYGYEGNMQIGALVIDRNGNFIATSRSGFYRYRKGTDTIAQRLTFANATFNINNRLLLDEKGSLWIFSREGEMLHIPFKGNLASPISQIDQITLPKSSYISAYYKNDIIWAFTNQEVVQFSVRNKTVRRYQAPKGIVLQGNILPFGSGYLLGTNRGLLFFTSDKSFSPLTYSGPDARLFSESRIILLYQDRSMNIWAIGDKGVFMLDEKKMPFRTMESVNQFLQTKTNLIAPLYFDSQDRLWAGANDQGFAAFDRSGKQLFSSLSHRLPLSFTRICFTITGDKTDSLWFGGMELFKMPVSLTKAVNYRPDPENPHALSEWVVWSILCDRDNRMWIATTSGLNRYDRKSNQFKVYRNQPNNKYSLGNDQVWTLYQSSDGLIWAGTSSGFSIFDEQTQRFTNFVYNTNRSVVLANMSTKVFFEDVSKRYMWIGSEGMGLLRFDKEKKNFIQVQSKDSRFSSTVWNINQDKAGNLWVGTSDGLFVVDTKTLKIIRHYDKFDGLPHDEFCFNGYERDKQGNLYLVTKKGLAIFHPDSIKPDTIRSLPPVLSQVKVDNIECDKSKLCHLYQTGVYTDSLVISSSVHSLALQLRSFLYSMPKKSRVLLISETGDTLVASQENEYEILLENLNAGIYRFEAVGLNADGLPSLVNRVIYIRVTPAYTLVWVLLSVTLIVAGGWAYRKGRGLQHKADSPLPQQQKAEEAAVDTNTKYQKYRLSTQAQQALLDTVKACMRDKKLYLNPELSLQMVADEIQVSRNEISMVLNELDRKNFYDFINEYRVQEFKQRVADPANESFTLLAIAMECGFNSKSSFFSTFKKVTGQTPSEYKKELETGKRNDF